MDIKSQEYRVFYQILYKKILEKEFKNERPPSARKKEYSPELWTVLGIKDFQHIFGNSTDDETIFYRKWSQANPKRTISISIDEVLIFKALIYIGIKLPSEMQVENTLITSDLVGKLFEQLKINYSLLFSSINSQNNEDYTNDTGQNNSSDRFNSSNENISPFSKRINDIEESKIKSKAHEHSYWCYFYNFLRYSLPEDIDKEYWLLTKAILVFRDDPEGDTKIYLFLGDEDESVFIGKIESNYPNRSNTVFNLSNGKDSLVFVIHNFASLLHEIPIIRRYVTTGNYIKYSNKFDKINSGLEDKFHYDYGSRTGYIALRRITDENSKNGLIVEEDYIPKINESSQSYRESFLGVDILTLYYLYSYNVNIKQPQDTNILSDLSLIR